jgi:hypothetical protein
METEVKLSKLLVVERIVNKYAGEKNGKVSWLCARNKTIVSGPLGDMRELTKATPAMEEFDKVKPVMAREFADRDEEGNPKQEVDDSTGQLRYVISKFGAFSEALDRLMEEKYPQAKIDTQELNKKTRELLDEKVSIDFYRMELQKLPGFRHEKDEDNGIIESGDLAVFYDLGIVYDPTEGKDAVVEEAPKKEIASA